MKILFVNDYSFPRGGAEVLVANERAELEARGHGTELLSLDSALLHGAADAWPQPFADPASRSRSLAHQLWHPRADRATRATVRSLQPDLIHFHTLTRLGPGVMDVADRVPAVITLHDYAVMYPLLRTAAPQEPFCDVGDFACCAVHAGRARYTFESIRTRRHRRMLRRLKCVIVPSEYMRAVATACGIERVTVCANGVPDSHHAGGAVVRSPVVLYVGRLEREKGVFPLVAAFELLADRLDGAELRLAGAGGELAALSERVLGSRHASRMAVLGALPTEQLTSAYSEARVVALPALWPEPFGLTGVEAMQAGTPVVGSGRGGMTEWLTDGVNGLRGDPQDTVAFSHTLEAVVSDDALFARLSRGSRETANRFSIQRHVDCLEGVYARALTAESSRTASAGLCARPRGR